MEATPVSNQSTTPQMTYPEPENQGVPPGEPNLQYFPLALGLNPFSSLMGGSSATTPNPFSSIATSDLDELRKNMYLSMELRPPRNRKPNYTDNEKRIILSLISPYLQILDAKSQERSIITLKNNLWKKITATYNEFISKFPGNYVPRDLEELRTFWKNMRRSGRRRREEHIAGVVPDLGERMGSDSSSSGKFDGPSTSFVACSPGLDSEEAVLGGMAPVPHDPLLADPMEQDELEEPVDTKPDIFEETLEDDVSNSNSQPITSEQSPAAGGASYASGMSGFYLLKKDTHCTTILDQLLHDETFADVTLTAQGGSVKAHRIVLSLASGYFREVLSKESSVKNVIVFKDLKFAELKNVLNFIYTGEATVDASELESFMSIAEMLEITSLCDGHKSLPKQFISQHREGRKSPSPAPQASVSKVGKRTAAMAASSSSSLVAPAAAPSPPPKARKILPPTPDPISTSKKTSSNPPDPAETIIKTEPETEAYDGLLDLNYDDSIPGPSKGAKEKRTREDPSPDDPVPGRCPYCPASAPYHMGEEMTVHLQMNHSSKPFINCHHCSRVFTLKSLYRKHQEQCKAT